MTHEFKLVSAHEAADQLHVHYKTVARLMRMGELQGIRVANGWAVDDSSLDLFSKCHIGKKGWPPGLPRGERRC